MGEEEPIPPTPKVPGFQDRPRTPPPKEIDYWELKELLETNKIYLIDVRNRDEIKNFGRIPYANVINIPSPEFAHSFVLDENEFRAKYGTRKIVPTDEIAVSCKNGRRAAVAYQTAKEFGVKLVRLYSGSFDDWKKQCGPHSRKLDCDQCRYECASPFYPERTPCPHGDLARKGQGPSYQRRPRPVPDYGEHPPLQASRTQQLQKELGEHMINIPPH